MTSNLRKRIIALMLAAMMTATSFAACSTDSGEASEGGDSSTDSSAAEGSYAEEGGDAEGGDASTSNMDGDIQLNELGEFPLVIGDPVTFTVFASPHIDANSEFDSSVNAFSAWLEEKTNIHLDWTIATKADKTAKLNVMFNSDDYQELIFGTYWDGATQYAYGEQGYLQPLNEYMENDSFYYDQYIQTGYDTGLITDAQMSTLVMPDGNIYSAPEFGLAYHSRYAARMYIYQPWLDAVGMDMPTTTDEYYEVLKAFATQDPNGNGETDEIPLAGSAIIGGWNDDPIEFLMNSFQYHQLNADARTFIEDGQVVMNYTTDEFKAGLEYMAMLAEEGLLMKETYTQDPNAVKALSTQDVQLLGSAPGGAWSSFTVSTSGEDGDWTNYVAMPPLEGPEGVQYAKYFVPNPSAKIHVTDKCENVKTAWRFIDSLYETEIAISGKVGLQGEYWQYAEEGDLGLDGEPAKYTILSQSSDGNNTATNYTWSQIAVCQEPPGWHTGQTMKFDAGVDTEGLLYQAGVAYAPYEPEADIIMPKLIFNEDDSKTVIDLQTAINDFVDSSVASFVRDGGIEEGWDTYLATLESMGVNDLQALYQQGYEERLAVMG